MIVAQSNQLQLRLLPLILDVEITDLHAQEVKHIAPTITPKQRLTHPMIIRQPEERCPERPQFHRLLRLRRQHILVLGRLRRFKDLRDILFRQCLSEASRHVLRLGDVNVVAWVEGIVPQKLEGFFELLARVVIFHVEHAALWLPLIRQGNIIRAGSGTHENAQDGEKGRGLQLLGPEPFDRALEVVGPVFRFGGEGPRRFVPRADVDAAEEDGVELDFYVVLREELALLPEIDQCEVAVW